MKNPQPQRPLLIFLCHASNDKPSVRELYQRLRSDGFDPWLDEESLVAGQEWEQEIPKVVRASDVVLVCLSRASISKTGYVQKELKFALDVADEQPEGTIFIIPAKLEECDVPARLRRWHWVNLFEDKGYNRLTYALAMRQQTRTKEAGHSDTSLGRAKRSARQIILYEERLFLGEIVDNINLTQTELARLAMVSQSWLSQVLTGRRTRVDREMFARVASVLVDCLKRLDSNSKLPDDRTRTAFSFLSRFTNVAAAFVPRRVYRPGGPIQIDAAHYIERDQDEVAFKALQDVPFTMLVAGPVQCGKSSLLARLERGARDVGFETAWFDPRLPSAVTSTPTTQQSDIHAPATMLLAELLQAQWGLELRRDKAPDSLPKLSHWLLRASAHTASRPRLLIIDDLARLGERAVEDWLTLFVRAIDNRRSTESVQVSIAVGLTHHFSPHFNRRLANLSSLVNWWPRIELGWFKDEEVIKLVDAVNGVSPESSTIFNLFSGQPYLTHAAAADTRFLESVQRWTNDPSEITARPVRESHAYRRHINAIKFSMLGPTLTPEFEIRELLQSFIDACSKHRSLDPDHMLFLNTAKLLDKAREPALPIYRLIAEDLAEQIGERSTKARTPRFQVGGTLTQGKSVYVKRPEDREFLACALERRAWSNIYGCRTMGKTSLYFQHLGTLREAGLRAISVDIAAEVGRPRTGREWVFRLGEAMATRLHLESDQLIDPLMSLPADVATSTALEQLLVDGILKQFREPLLLIFDEFDHIQVLDYCDEILFALRHIQALQAQAGGLNRLSVCLVSLQPLTRLRMPGGGSTSPNAIPIEMHDFEPHSETVQTLLRGFPVDRRPEELMLHRVLELSGGQPLITMELLGRAQKLDCRTPAAVDSMAGEMVADSGLGNDLQLFAAIEKAFMSAGENALAALRAYELLLKDRPEAHTSPGIDLLLLYGLVRRKKDRLEVKGELFRRRFDAVWVKRMHDYIAKVNK